MDAFRSFTSAVCLSGYRIMISSISDIDPRCPPSNVSSPSAASTPRRATSGRISSVIFENCDVLSFPICNKINLCFSTGVVAFVGLSVYFLSRPLTEIQLMEKLVFLIFFAGAIICLGLSFTYHTLCCNENRKISLLFAK